MGVNNSGASTVASEIASTGAPGTGSSGGLLGVQVGTLGSSSTRVPGQGVRVGTLGASTPRVPGQVIIRL